MIIDTGTTGASMSRDLYEAYLALAQANSMQMGLPWSEARRLEVRFDGTDGSEVSLEMYVAWLCNSFPSSLSKKIIRLSLRGITTFVVSYIFSKQSTQVGKHPDYGLGLDLVTPMEDFQWKDAEIAPPYEDVMLMGLGFLQGKRIMLDTQEDQLTVF